MHFLFVIRKKWFIYFVLLVRQLNGWSHIGAYIRYKIMGKKVVGYIKLQIPAGKANPSPPVGPALGQRGLNIMEFCKAFNAATQSKEPGMPIPVVITAYG